MRRLYLAVVPAVALAWTALFLAVPAIASALLATLGTALVIITMAEGVAGLFLPPHPQPPRAPGRRR